MQSVLASSSTVKDHSHILLTVLGTNPKEAQYTMNGRAVHAQLAPLALLDLLSPDQQPDAVVALCTEEASQDSWPILSKRLPNTCSAQKVDVPSGHSQDDINTFLSRAAAAIPASEGKAIRISIDVTHGFRHFSFLTYIAGLYLVSLRDIELSGAWYGLLQQGVSPSPFLDLRPLLKLPHWIHALQVMRETGSALPLAKALQDGVQASEKAKEIAKDLRRISEAYLSALPLELGNQVKKALDKHAKGMPQVILNSHQLPLAPELVNRLEDLLRPFTFQEHVTGEGWKGKILLSTDELLRQGRLIDKLFEHKDDAMALGLLREWSVSWVLWSQKQSSDWLNHNTKRRRAEQQLGAIKAAVANKQLTALLTSEQKELGKFWGQLTSLRNGFHHHGMRKEVLVGDQTEKNLQKVKSYWHETLQACPRFPLSVGDGTTSSLLITPFGNSPGLLFSALLACRDRIGDLPSSCLVICSKDSAEKVNESANRAEFSGAITCLTLDDPYGGTGEFDRLKENAQPICFHASIVLVNVTGGTTVMGLAAQELGELAKSFARPVQRFGLIDRRSPEEQKANPYQPGEAFWLKGFKEEQ